MKNIVFVIESLHLGGAEKSLVTLLKNLDYTKYKVDLITFQPDGFFKNEVPQEVNHIVYQLPKLSLLDRIKFRVKRKLNKGRFHHAQLFWTIISKKLQRLDKKYDTAIAYNQGFATYFTNQFINASMKYAWINTDYFKAGYNITFDYPIYKNFNRIVTVSQEAYDSFTNELDKNRYHLEIQIIKDISDIDDIRIKANEKPNQIFNSNAIKINSVGRLVKYKGFDLAIEACKILVDKGYPIHWQIVGEGDERAALEHLIEQNHLKDSIRLIGATTNPYPYMKACDIYVQTSLFEGLGLTVIEASYLHKPIVTTNFPTAYGLLQHEKTGLICEMNAKSIADSIELLINNNDLRNKLINNLEQLENRDKEKTLNQVEKLIS